MIASQLALPLPLAHAQRTGSGSALPALGDGADMSLAAERQLGDRIARELYRDPDYLDDPILSNYVQGIWQPLLAAARARGDLSAELSERFAWQVLLGKDRSINAFALPGGWLGLHLGLISATATRDELASVLAHELSHVTQRHIARLIAQSERQSPLMIGAIILGVLAASKSPNAANAMIAGGQAVAIQNQLNFSRDMEREADRIGYGVLADAGFDTMGFVGMFDKLQQAARHNDNGNFPYLRTHPLTTERIADMQARQQLAPRPAAVAPLMEHALMAGRARVLSNPGVDTLRAIAAEADAAPRGPTAQAAARQAGALYAAVLAHQRLRDPAAAARALARLQPMVASDAAAAREVRWLAAELDLANAQAARAAERVSLSAPDRAEWMLAAQAALAQGDRTQAAAVAQRLQTAVAQQPRDATAWMLLARAHALLGFPLRAVRAEAEAQVALMDYQAALDRFRAGQDLARRGAAASDHIEASIIDTRARQLESIVREQALER